MARESLGEFELMVILAALRLGPTEAYTVSIARVIEERSSRSVRRQRALDAATPRGEGAVSTRLGDPRPERGGSPGVWSRSSREGIEAVRVTTDAIRAMASGLEDAIGGAV